MIILDTNVISEPMKPDPDSTVVAWLDPQIVETLYLTATSLSELLTGIQMLPQGKRKQRLAEDARRLVGTTFGPRILLFDREAAVLFPDFVARAKSAGRPVALADAQIGSVAAWTSYSVATRDIGPFQAMGVPVINPWNA